MAQQNERNQAATVYVGDLDDRIDDSLLWEVRLEMYCSMTALLFFSVVSLVLLSLSCNGHLAVSPSRPGHQCSYP